MRSNRYGDQRQIIFAVSDTATQIVSPTKRFFVIVNPLVGIATLFCMVLPDARTIRLGTPFVFENQSSDFVGIYNADRTTFHRLPPRATLTCVLTTQASASGTWHSVVHDPAVGNPAFGMSSVLDFVALTSGNNMFSDPGFTGVPSGAGAINLTTGGSVGGRQGSLTVSCGTTVAGYSLVYAGSSGENNYIGSGCRAFETSQAISAISSAADEYIARYGIGDNITGGAHTEAAYFMYDRLNLGTNWQLKTIKTAGGAANTVTDTGVAPIYGTTGAEWQKLRIEIASSGARADGWIDNVLISPAGGQANLPAATTAIKIAHMGITKTEDAGVNARYLKVDYLRLQSYPTTPR
jgi:hypothetical protein